MCKLTILCKCYFRGVHVSPAQYRLICQRLLSADNKFEIKFVYSFSHWVLGVTILDASCVAWCLRGEVLFFAFCSLTIKAAVTLVNLHEHKGNRDVSTLYVLIGLGLAATRYQNNCQVSHKLSVKKLFTNIRFYTLLSQKNNHVNWNTYKVLSIKFGQIKFSHLSLFMRKTVY